MGTLNKYDGTGNSIVGTHSPTATVLDTGALKTDIGACRGMTSLTTGTIKVKLPRNDNPEQVFVFAGKDCLYDVTAIYDDGPGDVPITDIQLFW